ncbi:hypothetical protein [Sphingomonas sp. CFBP 13720]|uniref:hypothetical protein n=1 Tax=Sphingomonas sp. CFBP 13720 TaxID=2775302 RepID=UPI00177FA4C9|nr:hypothetical protein [Sphingomonas sp. CFBP 13720]MBD8679348.1 hypothetical protein [Sphingomonas sp. CFBP 13720]
MSQADDPIDRLGALSPGDRRAVLARLAPTERRRVVAALDAADPDAASPFAADIAARIAAPGDAMTPAARAVLTRMAGQFAPPSPSQPGPSLFGRLRAALGGG